VGSRGSAEHGSIRNTYAQDAQSHVCWARLHSPASSARALLITSTALQGGTLKTTTPCFSIMRH
jgi:hypothetical protein